MSQILFSENADFKFEFIFAIQISDIDSMWIFVVFLSTNNLF